MIKGEINADSLSLPPLSLRSNLPIEIIKTENSKYSSQIEEKLDFEPSNKINENIENIGRIEDLNQQDEFFTPDMMPRTEDTKYLLYSHYANDLGIVIHPEQIQLLIEFFPESKRLAKYILLSKIAKQNTKIFEIGLNQQNDQPKIEEKVVLNKARKRFFHRKRIRI